MIELRNIETFFWVATLGSFRAASDKLNTTQPAVSQRIASLEADLGVRLFERDARGVKLTAKGHELLSHAERMLQVRRDMFEAAREQNVMTGTVRIGVAETIVQTWLPTLIELVHAAYPALVLEIEVDTTHVLRSHLMSRQIDLAFLMGPVLEARVENLPLCTYPLAWVASPLLELGPEPLTLERIGRLPIVTYPSNSAPYRVVRDMLTRAGVVSPRMYGSASMSMVVRMTQDCIGTSVIAPVFLGKELARGELRILRVDADPLPELSFTATWVQGAGQPCGAPDRADGAEGRGAGRRRRGVLRPARAKGSRARTLGRGGNGTHHDPRGRARLGVFPSATRAGGHAKRSRCACVRPRDPAPGRMVAGSAPGAGRPAGETQEIFIPPHRNIRLDARRP